LVECDTSKPDVCALLSGARLLPIGNRAEHGRWRRGGAKGARGGLVVNIDEAFARVVGRPASEERRDRLHRLREALGLGDNDAFWSIVMALEYCDSLFRQSPARLAEETRRSVDGARAAFAVAAEKETAHVERVLSEKVAATSVEIARKLADKPLGQPLGLQRVTNALAAVVAFGAQCVSGGYSLGRPAVPLG
jgi:hypothetical protein